MNSFDVQGTVIDLGPNRGFRTELTARREEPGGGAFRPPSTGWHSPEAGSNPSDALRIFCRRDDYAFLPPQSVGGLPCERPTSTSTRDPRAIAEAMWDQLELPQLQLGMNPQRGLVAVPTWFWLDGYDGTPLSLLDTLLLPRQVCQQVVDRDGRGDVVLDGLGHPSSHRVCQTVWDSLSVQVVAWPTSYRWDFGDAQSTQISCPGRDGCAGGLGRPYTDPRSPSPIAHAYVWSSLGANGDQDAYLVQAAIRFGAHFRFSVNGQGLSSWQPLRERQRTVSAAHQVQEAQAVLSGP